MIYFCINKNRNKSLSDYHGLFILHFNLLKKEMSLSENDSDNSDFSFEIDNEQFNNLYTRQLQKKKPVVSKIQIVSERERSRSRERSRQKKPNRNWHIYSSCLPIDIDNDRFLKIRSLPIFKKKDEIIDNIIHNQITLITGETGCGKSTQVPRLLFEYLKETNNAGKIICVQPRRLAVKNLHKILSVQIPEKDIVGYQIAMESRVAQTTKIMFMTNGIFLQRLIHSSSIFEEFPFIILD